MRVHQQQKNTGFTLIEMVGVLAVIAILAAILVPKIFSAIEESRYNNAISSINGVKAATMSYFSKNGSFIADEGATKFDARLITNGDLERPFASRIGSDWECNALLAASAGGTVNFNSLDGNGAPAKGIVVQCVLKGVPAADAYELSKRMDGDLMSAIETPAVKDGEGNITTPAVPALENPDTLGRVVYAKPADNKTTVYVYIAHK